MDVPLIIPERLLISPRYDRFEHLRQNDIAVSLIQIKPVKVHHHKLIAAYSLIGSVKDIGHIVAHIKGQRQKAQQHFIPEPQCDTYDIDGLQIPVQEGASP